VRRQVLQHQRQVLVGELARRDVHRHLQAVAEQFPLARLAAGFLADPGPDRRHRRRILEHGQEDTGRDHAQARVLPAQQGLGPDHCAVGGADLRLVEQHELAPLERGKDFLAQLQALLDHLRRFGREHAEGVAAIGLGRVHGGVGIVEQFVRRVLAGLAERDADAGAHRDLQMVDRDRLGHALQDAGRQRPGRLEVGVGEHEHEFVAADPRDRGVGVREGGQAAPDLLQGLVAGLVAVGVVDFLEVVEVDEQRADHAVARQRLIERAQAAEAVVQAGQAVVGRHVDQARLGFLARGDVGKEYRQAILRRIGARFEPAAQRRVVALAARVFLALDCAVVGLVEGTADRLRKLVPDHLAQQLPAGRLSQSAPLLLI
jgi:hypothetical protein